MLALCKTEVSTPINGRFSAMILPSREFPNWYVIALSTGEKYDWCKTFGDAMEYADSRFIRQRSEHFQVFHDDGAKVTMIYDAFVGDLA